MQNQINLPHNDLIESRLLAGILSSCDPETYQKAEHAILSLDPDCFHNSDNYFIFKKIKKAYEEDGDFSIIGISTICSTEELVIIQDLVLNQYIKGKIYSEDIDSLKNFAIIRHILTNLRNIVYAPVVNTNPQEMMLDVLFKLNQLCNVDMKTKNNYVQTSKEILEQYWLEQELGVAVIDLNLRNFPKLHTKSLVTVAGRPSTGKTNFGLFLMDRIVKALPFRQALYFNLEMKPADLLSRLICTQGITRKNDADFLKDHELFLLDYPWTVISKPVLTIEEIEFLSKIQNAKKQLSVIVVDYTQLVRSNRRSESNHLEQADIAKRLAGLAMELDCVVIALSQVNREYKNKPIGERIPNTSDASESMGTVNSSTWWIGIDRPEIDDPENIYFRNLFQVACRKNRGDGGNFFTNFGFKDGVFFPWVAPFRKSDQENDPRSTIF